MGRPGRNSLTAVLAVALLSSRIAPVSAFSTSKRGLGLTGLRSPTATLPPTTNEFLWLGSPTASRRIRPSRYYDTPLAAASAGGSDRTLGLEFWEKVAVSLSQNAAERIGAQDGPREISTDKDKAAVQLVTLLRVGVPAILSGVLAFALFPFLSMNLAALMNDAGVFAVLSQDSSQFVQNFLTVAGLLFSILVGQTYYFMYQQQEAVFYALFNEVSEAKSLLEQVALVCQGRAMYQKVLQSISSYVEDDLKQLQADPAVLLSARPVDDPLETIMYMTSVGVPSSVYETVRSLRQARATRLGALQRKLPQVHMILLWLLAAIELCSFPLLGAGTQTIGGYSILTVEGCLFGIMTFGIVMTLRVVGELWRPAGGAYNVDGVLCIMVRGLELELRERTSGKRRNNLGPTAPFDVGSPDDGAVRDAAVTEIVTIVEAETVGKEKRDTKYSQGMLQQGSTLAVVYKPVKKAVRWLANKRR